jgi:hypothetical protein
MTFVLRRLFEIGVFNSVNSELFTLFASSSKSATRPQLDNSSFLFPLTLRLTSFLLWVGENLQLAISHMRDFLCLQFQTLFRTSLPVVANNSAADMAVVVFDIPNGLIY